MVKLRQFSFPDLDRILEIEKVSFPNREAWSREYFEKLYFKYPKGFIVAENKNEIVGYTIGQPKNRVPTKRVAEIISLAVAPDWRQKGIGKALIEFLINHFRQKNIKEIFLNVRTKNKAAISFYQKLGFKILKTIKNYYKNGDDAYLMKKEI
ncbi:MAG: ribosomal protein S18-alanine N-acetyltransferase [Patescibacteria group bacterium]|nr:ribosomal protein S18-alanine N-acetyltransferase [Patescibacteria group bacterium]